MIDRSFALALAGIVLVSLLIGYAVALDEEKNGARHCGEVETTTSDGKRALERQCWRSK